MSQAGYTPIQLYYSATAAATPSAGNLANGELAVNITDGKLFYKDNGGVVRVLATAAGSAGDVVGPGSSTDNALVRFDGTTGKLVQSSVGVLSDAGVLTGLTGLTSSGSITFSGLTSGRVTYAGTGGLLQDSANLTFDGTTLTANALTVSNAVTLSAGTANGVAYLNGSKVLTTGSALTFDGSTFGVAVSGSTDALRITQTGTGNAFVVEDSTSPDASPFVIDASGNTAVGSEIVATALSGSTPKFSVNGTTLATATQATTNWGNSATSPVCVLSKSRGGTTGVHTIVQSGDGLGAVAGLGSDGTNFVQSARIDFQVDGTPGTNDMPGRLVFSTTADGASTPTERMRIDSSGNVGIGTSSPAYQLETTSAAKIGTSLGINSNPSVNVRLYVNQGADYTLGTDYGLYLQGSGYAGGISLNATSMQIGQNSSSRSLTFHSGTSFAERARIDSSGNLLVGTTSGSYKVDVSGDVNVTGSYRVNGVATTGLTGGQTGSAPLYGARAWVNFNGTGTVAIRASGNVSSITDNGTGDYTVNFTNAMPDANYNAVISQGNDNAGNSGVRGANILATTTAPTTSAVRVGTWVSSGTRSAEDSAYVFVAIFR